MRRRARIFPISPFVFAPPTGPGADGLIVVLPGEPGVDFAMLFYNADGSLGEMCGNGARCVARYAVEHGLSPDPEHIRFQATAGLITARRIDRERYEVRLPDPSVIDLHRVRPRASAPMWSWATRACPTRWWRCPPPPLRIWTPCGSGAAPCAQPRLSQGRQRQLRLPHRGKRVRAITFERGVEDFTLACGTGCGAIALSLILRGRIPGDRVEIDMPGGHLSVRLTREGDTARDLLLTGPTALVEEGACCPPAPARKFDLHCYPV